MVVRVNVEPALLVWARERARLDQERLLTKFPKLTEWEVGDSRPTLKQLEKYAEATHIALGFLLLQRPPTEAFPSRTFGPAATGLSLAQAPTYSTPSTPVSNDRSGTATSPDPTARTASRSSAP